jgi:DNA-binding IclR family transcriptional regulator
MAHSELVQALQRGLDILRVLAEAAQPVALRDLAGVTGLKPSTAHNLLRTLAAGGFAERTPDGPRYLLGPAIHELSTVARTRGCIGRAETEMRRLAAAFPTATLTVARQVGADIVVELRMSPDRPGLLQRPSGQCFNPYSTASGLLFQAFGGADTVLCLRQRYPLPDFAAETWPTPAAFEAHLEKIRRTGISVHPFSRSGFRSLATPIFGTGGALLASLGFSASEAMVPAAASGAAVAERLVTAARQLSAPASP